MAVYNLNDTIVAISTPLGESGIGIVRLSGKEALPIADKIFVSKDKQKPSIFKTYTVHYGWIADNTKRKVQSEKPAEVIDEVILTVMKAPRSYTKEDIVEINCHGGIVPLRKVLDLVLENGARLAEPGEFTKRAFLNGRIDLTQAEAVLDVVKAQTDSALKIGMEQLRGFLSKQINKTRSELLDILANLEANIDFPEEEILSVDTGLIGVKLEEINKSLEQILDNSKYGRVLREGINIVICGRPNVGKSSLLNAFLKQERSIVTHIAGTTRDTIEEVIDIKGIPVRIVDTAGIIEPADLIEKKAMQRSKKCIDSADLVLLLFEGSDKLKRDDFALIRRLKKKNVFALINKIDLKQKIERKKIQEKFSKIIEISAKKNKNINLLEQEVANLVYNGKLGSNESATISNLRHIEAIRKANKSLAFARGSLKRGLSIEFVAEGIREAIVFLDGILGKKFTHDLLDRIFGEFCIGK